LHRHWFNRFPELEAAGRTVAVGRGSDIFLRCPLADIVRAQENLIGKKYAGKRVLVPPQDD
jgi:hypothetical protein